MKLETPDYYDDLDLTFAHAWSLWTRGGSDRRSAFHTPAVATVDATGMPQARVMVLREASRAQRSLRFHTDSRSHKVSELSASGAITVLGYDAAAKIQLRVRGRGEIQVAGDTVEAAWASTGLPSRKCYLAEPGSGSPTDLPTSGLIRDYDSRDPTLAESLPGRAHFAVLLVDVMSLEWVYLAAQGHRRARFDWIGHEWVKRWLIP